MPACEIGGGESWPEGCGIHFHPTPEAAPIEFRGKFRYSGDADEFVRQVFPCAHRLAERGVGSSPTFYLRQIAP